MWYNYDKDKDVLTIKLKEGVPCYPVEYNNGVTYLISKNNSDESVGYIIPTFIKNFDKKFLPMPDIPDLESKSPFNYLVIKENILRGIDSCAY